MNKKTPYDLITEALMNALDAGVAPWQKTWVTGMPKNLSTGKDYRGINVWILGSQPFSSPYWLTFNQARKMGGMVRGGESGTAIIFWQVNEREQSDGSMKKSAFMRKYMVFNLEQIEGIEAPVIEGGCDFVPIEKAQSIVDGWADMPTVNHGGHRAFYRPATDSIHMPAKDAFESPEAYYATLFHEMGHSTGAEKRLNRPGIAEFDGFGSHQYSYEELVAETCSAFLCHAANIEGRFDNSVAYLASWRQKLKDDGPAMFMRAAQNAQKAADLILTKTEATVS